MKKIVWKLFFSGMLLSCSIYAMEIESNDDEIVPSSEEDRPGAGKLWQSDDEFEFNETLPAVSIAEIFARLFGSKNQSDSYNDEDIHYEMQGKLDQFDQSILNRIKPYCDRLYAWWYSKEN